MKVNLNLSPDDERSLSAALTSYSERARHPISLNGLISRWTCFVSDVERGFDKSLYEYTNELSVRDMLDEILKGASQSVRDKLGAILEPWDDRFLKATADGSVSVAGGRGSRNWWWDRLPRLLLTELKADLECGGFGQNRG